MIGWEGGDSAVHLLRHLVPALLGFGGARPRDRRIGAAALRAPNAHDRCTGDSIALEHHVGTREPDQARARKRRAGPCELGHTRACEQGGHAPGHAAACECNDAFASAGASMGR